jgi:hypothetical protein
MRHYVSCPQNFPTDNTRVPFIQFIGSTFILTGSHFTLYPVWLVSGVCGNAISNGTPVLQRKRKGPNVSPSFSGDTVRFSPLCCKTFSTYHAIQPLTEMSTRNIKIIKFLGSKVRQVRRADKLTAIYEPIV